MFTRIKFSIDPMRKTENRKNPTNKIQLILGLLSLHIPKNSPHLSIQINKEASHSETTSIRNNNQLEDKSSMINH